MQRFCATPRCPELVEGDQRHCAQHRRQVMAGQDRLRGTAHQRGYGKDWRLLRREVLASEPFCRQCGAAAKANAPLHLDHIVPKSQGGTDDRANLQPLCPSCHSAKTMSESVARQPA